jgi:hypothetical protein
MGGVMNIPLTPLDTYLFDLRGYLVLKNALNPDEVRALNAELDAIQVNQPGQWHGWVHAHSYGGKDGTNFQQIYEAGPAFESLIDHPSWIEKVKTFVGGEGTFDYQHGALFIDENFANLRGPGEAIGLHSGGHNGTKRTQFRYRDGRFHCGQINIIMALNDIGPGDGATMVIPGSHKSNFLHPDFDKYKMKATEMTSLNDVEGAIEVHLQAGDALLFVDAIAHGSAERINPGQRRITVYRYGPSWGFFRHPYRPSPGMLARLTPERRAIVWPHEHRLAPPEYVAAEGVAA